jgi:hypothetical protein
MRAIMLSTLAVTAGVGEVKVVGMEAMLRNFWFRHLKEVRQVPIYKEPSHS